MTDSSADRDPLDRLAEEFVARFRAGERPSVEEFATRLPDRADEVRDLFPALVEMEQLKPGTGDRTGGCAPAVEPSDPVRLGDFRILRRVGTGGMGVVYEAVQESLGRHVALKLLPADAVADPRRLERFRREAKSAAKLHHTNIVPVFGVGQIDGRHYYAMQFIAGHPLDAVIDEVRGLRANAPAVPPHPVSEVARALLTGTFAGSAPDNSGAAPTVTHAADGGSAPAVPPNSSALSGTFSAEGHYWTTVARLGTQVADALGYAHAQGVIHRDVKPANLLLDAAGTVWVTDFGLAKSADADDLTQAGDIVGTLRYMAPERFDGSGDHRADTYALGLTLYELLTLTPAFQAPTRAKLVEQVLSANPPKPRAVDPVIPRDLETVVLKAIARDPAMRYQTAGDLADDLRRYLEDRPIRARRASSAEQAFRWCRRNKAVAALLTAVLLVFAAGAGVSAFFAVRAEQKATEARGEAERADGERDRANDEAAKVRAEQDRTRNLLYLARMADAGAAYQDNRIGRVLDLLGETTPAPGEPDPRGWEWHFLRRATTSPARVIPLEKVEPSQGTPSGPGPGRRYAICALSPDGRVALINKSGSEPTLERWDLPAGKRLGTSTGWWRAYSSDGRFALREIAEKGAARLVIRDLDTGLESPGPSGALPEFTLPGGSRALEYGWTHLAAGGEYAVATTGEEPDAGQNKERPLFVWKRATGKITRLDARVDPNDVAKTGHYGANWGDVPFLSSDGKTLLQTSTWIKVGAGTAGESVVQELQIDRWDVSAEPPKWLGSARVPGQVDYGTRDNLRGTASFSRNGEWYGFLRGRQLQVFRVADGRQVWSAALPDGPPVDPFGAGVQAQPRPPVVADSGDRVIVHDQAYTVLAVDRPDSAADPVGRTHRLHADADQMRETGFRSDHGAGSADGRVLVLLSKDESALCVWNLAQLPTVAAANRAPPRARPQQPDQVHFTPDGSRALHFPRIPFRGALGPRDAFALRDGPSWRDIPIAPPPGMRLAGGGFVAGGDRVLLTFVRPEPPKGPDEPVHWALHDTADGQPVARGEFKQGPGREAGLLSCGPWLLAKCKEYAVEEKPGGGWQRVTEPDPDAPPPPPGGQRMLRPKLLRESVVVRDARTGREIRRPEPGEFPDFHPVNDSMAPLDQPVLIQFRHNRSATPADNVARGATLHSVGLLALDRLTARPLWRREVVDEVRSESSWNPEVSQKTFAYASGVKLSPDGRRIALLWEPEYSSKETRVWIGSAADGATERFVALPAAAYAGPYVSEVWFSPDSRRLAVSRGADALVLDVATGGTVHRLTGHAGQVRGVAFSADSRRLFVHSMEHPVGVSRLAVWDAVTGRRLIEFPLAFEQPEASNNTKATVFPLGQLNYRDGKVYVTTGDGVRVFDGSPLSETK